MIIWNTKAPFFEPTSKRRKGFPSETRVKRGHHVVHGSKDLVEKLGPNDPGPCGSKRKFKNCCMCAGSLDSSANEIAFSPRLEIVRDVSRST